MIYMTNSLPYGSDSLKDLVRSIFGMHKIKYKVLDQFSIGKIDAFHINCDSLLHYYMKYYEKNSELKSLDTSYTIAAVLINTAAHYKHYFAKNKNNIKIFLYMTDDFKKEFHDVWQLLSVICKYIPNVYFIDSPKKMDIRVCIKYICKRYPKNVLLTKDTLDIVLTGQNISVIKSNKDKSMFYTDQNVYSQIIKKDYNGDLSSDLLPIVFSLCGLGNKCNKIKGLGPSKVLKIMNKGLKNSLIVNGRYPNIRTFLSDISPIFNVDDVDILISNFNIVDVDNKSTKTLTKASEKMIDSCLIDKFANKDLRELNIKYFKGFDSLMLDVLMEEADLSINTRIQW